VTETSEAREDQFDPFDFDFRWFKDVVSDLEDQLTAPELDLDELQDALEEFKSFAHQLITATIGVLEGDGMG
jgi:hypothetical protein